jgi:hypothetical protein
LDEAKMSRAIYRIIEGKKETEFCFSFDKTFSSSQFLISIDFELREDSHHSYFRDKISMFDFDVNSNFRTLIHEFVPSKETADKLASIWTEERLTKFASKSEVYWSIGDAPYHRGWLTEKGRKKWKRKYEKLGTEIASLYMNDDDFRGGITLDWLYFKHLWFIDGESFLVQKYLLSSMEGSEHIDLFFVENYEYMQDVFYKLKSENCPKPIKNWFNEFYENQINKYSYIDNII